MNQALSQRPAERPSSASLTGLIDGGLAAIAVLCVGFGLAAVLGILS